jgi:hypothetical protein
MQRYPFSAKPLGGRNCCYLGTAATDPKAKKRLIEFAKVHRKLAQSAAKKAKTVESEPPLADDATYQRALPLIQGRRGPFPHAADITEWSEGYGPAREHQRDSR